MTRNSHKVGRQRKGSEGCKGERTRERDSECGECGVGSRCMQDLMKRGERRTDLPRDAIRMRSFFPPAEIAMYLVLSPSVISARVVSARSRPLGHTDHRLVRYDSGMTSPFSQLCFRSIVHDIAAAMSRRPVCYHTFAKSLRFSRHHTQVPFEMTSCAPAAPLAL